MTDHVDVLIVGAGQAGAHAALFLRQQKYAGSILVVGEEPDFPYERPALSKDYLSGEKPFAKMLLRPEEFWTEKNVAFLRDERVERVAAAAHEVATRSGKTLRYGKLVWAAGGRPRRLPCQDKDIAGVHAIRDRADVDRVKAELEATDEAIVIGAGYIGLEAASVLRKRDKRVTVLEVAPRVLSRVAGEDVARFFEAEHRARGVDLRFGVEVVGIEHEDGRATGVRLATGEILPTRLVIVGIGILPTVEPLRAAGAAGDDGVLVDLHGKTSLPDVYAIGDCAAHPNVHAAGRVVRLESIQNANDQASIAAKSIAGTLKENERYDAVPWFWSDQFDLRLQTVGLSLVHDDVVVRGDPASKSFSAVYLRDGKVVALDCINKTKDYMQGKALIASGRVVEKAKLADPEVLLRDLATA